MTKPTHTYRKPYEHQFEAEGSANGFAVAGNLDKPAPTKAWVQEEDGTFFVYVELEASMDPTELLVATGFERVT